MNARYLLPLCTALAGGCAAGRQAEIVVVPVYEQEVSPPQTTPRALGDSLIAKYWDVCVGDAPFFMFAHPLFYDLPADLRALSPVAQRLSASDATSIVEAAIANSRKAFRTTTTTHVCALAGNPESLSITRALSGVGGLSPGPNKIVLLLHPQEGWEKHLAYVSAHEYHHSAWFARHYQQRQPWTLLRWMIHEGRADHFAERISKTDIRKWWTKAMAPDVELVVWGAIQPLLYVPDMIKTSKYIYGNGQDVPWLAGYQIGYNIVAAFLAKHPDLTIEQWSELSAEELYLESGYGPKSTGALQK